MAIEEIQFNSEFLNSPGSRERLENFLTGSNALESVRARAGTSIPSACNKLSGRWAVVRLEISSTFDDIAAIALAIISEIFRCFKCTSNLSKRCHVASNQRMASTLFLQHRRLMGEQFLGQSLNTHNPDSKYFYLHSSVSPGEGGEFEIFARAQTPRYLDGFDVTEEASEDRRVKQFRRDGKLEFVEVIQINEDRSETSQFYAPKGVDWFCSKGVCRGMSNWFLYLYFQTKENFQDLNEHIKAITLEFEKGAGPEAALLQSLSQKAVDVLHFSTETDVMRCDLFEPSREEIAAQLLDLNPGTYALYTNSHRVNLIVSENETGYFFNPTYGSDRFDSLEDLAKCVGLLVEDEAVNPFRRERHTLTVDRISYTPPETEE